MTTASIVVHKTPGDKLLKTAECALRSAELLYVIDNSPEETLRDVVESMNDPRVLYRHVENRGYGAAHNVAIRDAMSRGSDFHLVVNPDVWWHGDVVGKMVDFMRENPDVALMGPKVYYPDGMLQYTVRMLPTPFDLILKRFLPKKISERRMRRYLLEEADHSRPFRCSYLQGSFMLFRMSELKDVGLFDERFFMYPEDIDISRRISESYDALYWPEVSVIHEHAAASRTNRKMLKIHIVNMIRYFNKWGWWFDRGRRRLNRRLLRELPLASSPVPGRG